jgi:hypothetical protein
MPEDENLNLSRLTASAPLISAAGKFQSHHKTGYHIIKLEAL